MNTTQYPCTIIVPHLYCFLSLFLMSMPIVHYHPGNIAGSQTRFLHVTSSIFHVVYVDVFPCFGRVRGTSTSAKVPENTGHVRYEHHHFYFWGRETICSIVEEGSDRTVYHAWPHTCATPFCTYRTKSLDFFEARHQSVLVFLPQNRFDVLYVGTLFQDKYLSKYLGM